ncbi:hypothetical protein EXT68_03750 [Pectobacterium parmentieri]|uniref:ParB/Sulfiredoxin domain-containing protein n=1 Tax=Pectobacterium parmentieri TaxID=1905730 RepID=A0A0H3I3J7_PECPM|nr:ParB/Srx family N-terminal domain-containing protein [Pectobacterium parmentieri]AFI89924.1 Hypothetical protein W5S_1833 [Pectobacterium parmentieri]MBI0469330.1 hypothetical protein [Pectobacterium parmentieri]MBI0491954.1 hypothetical protein [Pectobacterium parmentieri]MBI0553238.1 hypothetical protein [Pectobacterium parmentieri]MBI0566365.1 hypothetical protein [Pectobacterium parmentieri]
MSRSDFTFQPNVSIDDILLDPQNPRIRAGEDQNDCISRVLRKEEQILRLMNSIALDGLSTMPILLMPNGNGKWVVKDGNRRITSLKLLNNPDLCPLETLRSKIRLISKSNKENIPKHIDCLSSSDSDAIAKEVISRHSGALGGAGQLDWSAYLRTVYLLNTGHPSEYKRAGQYLFWAENNKIPVEDDFPITNISRFFNEDNLKLLGFDISDDQLEPILPEDKLIRMAYKVINDFYSKRKTVNDVYTPEQAKSYLNEVRSSAGVVSDETEMEEESNANRPFSTNSSDNSGNESSSTTGSEDNSDETDNSSSNNSNSNKGEDFNGSEKKSKRVSPPRKPNWDRKKLFWKGASCPVIPSSELKARNIVREIGKINSEDATLAVTMLLRGLVELSVGYHRKNNNMKDLTKLADNMQSSADSMYQANKIDRSQLDLIKAYTNTSRTDVGILNIDTLQKYLHRETHMPNKQTIHTFWDEICFFVKLCWQ